MWVLIEYRMRGVGRVDISSSMLGIPTAMPVFVCPAALAGLGHPEGELNITRAAGRAEIIQGVRVHILIGRPLILIVQISANATYSIEEIAAARVENQPLFYQVGWLRTILAWLISL